MSVGAVHIFHARNSKYATPRSFSTRSPVSNVRANADSPATASVSHSASPSHIAARNGSTSRTPFVSTRATSAATLGPGVPAVTSRAMANTASADGVMANLVGRAFERCEVSIIVTAVPACLLRRRDDSTDPDSSRHAGRRGRDGRRRSSRRPAVS
ncbi:hypothetical protein BLAT2472_30045 [Burkholderia latens]